jgi:hypothetical protein
MVIYSRFCVLAKRKDQAAKQETFCSQWPRRRAKLVEQDRQAGQAIKTKGEKGKRLLTAEAGRVEWQVLVTAVALVCPSWNVCSAIG